MPKAARRLSGWKPESVAEINEVNDDEAELAQVADLKRQESEKRSARENSPYRETPGHQRRAKLLDSYVDCIKMCTENVRAAPARAAPARLPGAHHVRLRPCACRKSTRKTRGRST